MASPMLNPHLEHAMSMVSTYIPDAVKDNWRVIGTTAIMLGIGLCPMVAWAWDSYCTFLAVGPGGIPYNVFGWVIQGLAQPFARHDTRDPKPLKDPKNAPTPELHGQKSFLSGPSLPERSGERPDVPGFVAPQRQLNDHGPRNAEMRGRLISYQQQLVEANPELLFTAFSDLERRGVPAMWLTVTRDMGIPDYLKRSKGEFAHVHPEASTHAVLSLVDAEQLVRKGWGERHPLSGVKGFWPWTYVMVYAPRDDAEFEIWKKIIDASVRFVCAGRPEVRFPFEGFS